MMEQVETRGSARAVNVALLPGDGIGPEIMEAALRIALAAGAELNPTDDTRAALAAELEADVKELARMLDRESFPWRSFPQLANAA